jgi:EAL domain-containing protein (putative c-di-GMP-specific phosphodiesterase class I)
MPVADEVDPLLSEMLQSGDVRSLLQPIVDLSSGEIVAYEALARGPAGTALEHPDRLVMAARHAGRLHEVDSLCRLRANEAGHRAGLVAPHSLFVNVEPDALHHMVAEDLRQPPAILELTERALSLDPALLIRAVTALRELGWGFAIDDLGVNARSLALLPFIAPDVIKLDMSLIQSPPDRHAAMILSAVTAYTEATGALILAEGIETAEHLLSAKALGAELGQGWLFGRPAEADTVLAGAPGLTLRTPPRTWAPSATPYEIAASDLVPKIADKPLLLQLSTFLESRARRDAGSAVVLSAFQQTGNLTPPTVRRYRDLVSAGALVIVLARGRSAPDLAPDLHAVDLADDDPLAGEWAVAVISADFAALLAARELGSTSGRQFEYVLSHDRRLVLEGAHSLVARLNVQD